MLNFHFGHSRAISRLVTRSAKIAPYLALPVALLVLVSTYAFRPTPVISLPGTPLSSPLHLPPGWAPPPTPVDNPITAEKFTLGRQLFYEVLLSGDQKTSCATCHNPQNSFANSGKPSHAGAFGHTGVPARNVPRVVNVAYDSVLTWDGHLRTLEDQVQHAVVKRGDFEADTSTVIANLSRNLAYTAMFTKAFGSSEITMDCIAKSIATFERCLISANSPYDRYVNGDTSALTASAQRGMKLFFDTNTTNCTDCHNNLGSKNPNSSANLFTDNNYYRTGTFEPNKGGGYGKTLDTLSDQGRALITKDTIDIGRFRTPTLRNLLLSPPYGADGTVETLQEVVANYSRGGTGVRMDSSTGKFVAINNQDPRLRPLNLSVSQQQDLVAFLGSLTDLSFIQNPDFQDPGAATAKVDDRTVSENLSVYPNPAPHSVTVECTDLNGTVEASLVAMNGTTVWRGRALSSNGRLRLDFVGVAAGAYRLELQAGAVQKASRIVVER